MIWNHPYGERQYTAEDFAGRLQTLPESIADLDRESLGRRFGLPLMARGARL